MLTVNVPAPITDAESVTVIGRTSLPSATRAFIAVLSASNRYLPVEFWMYRVPWVPTSLRSKTMDPLDHARRSETVVAPVMLHEVMVSDSASVAEKVPNLTV